MTATATTPSLFTDGRLAPAPAASRSLTNALRLSRLRLAWNGDAEEARSRAGRSRRAGHRRDDDGSRIGGQTCRGLGDGADVGQCGTGLRVEVRRLPHPRRDRAVLAPVRAVGKEVRRPHPRDDEARTDAAVDAGARLAGLPQPDAALPDSH